MKEDCIFCKIARGEFESDTIYENKQFRVILDINPATKGHCLILPKMHAKTIAELPDELLKEVMILAKRIVIMLKKELECDGVNIVQNNGQEAGQTVFHYHLHIIPRYKEDKQNIGWVVNEVSEQEIICLKQKLSLDN